MAKSIYPRTTRPKVRTPQELELDTRWSLQAQNDFFALVDQIRPDIARARKKSGRKKAKLPLTRWRKDIVWQALRAACERYDRLQAAEAKHPSAAEARNHLRELEKHLAGADHALRNILRLLPRAQQIEAIAAAVCQLVERDNALRPRKGPFQHLKVPDIDRVVGVNSTLLSDVRYSLSRLRAAAGRPTNDAFEQLITDLALYYYRLTGCKPVVSAKPDKPNHFLKVLHAVYDLTEGPPRQRHGTGFHGRVDAILKRLNMPF